jgi:hypothetical protein
LSFVAIVAAELRYALPISRGHIVAGGYAFVAAKFCGSK